MRGKLTRSDDPRASADLMASVGDCVRIGQNEDAGRLGFVSNCRLARLAAGRRTKAAPANSIKLACNQVQF
jgi:hypothetical protein